MSEQKDKGGRPPRQLGRLINVYDLQRVPKQDWLKRTRERCTNCSSLHRV